LLKTAYPLLALSIETMIDQISKHLVPHGLEDLYANCFNLLSTYCDVSVELFRCLPYLSSFIVSLGACSGFRRRFTSAS
jgi:hypothetical protein